MWTVAARSRISASATGSMAVSPLRWTFVPGRTCGNFCNRSSTVLATATDGYHYHLVEAATPDRLSLIEKELKEHGFLAPLQPWEH